MKTFSVCRVRDSSKYEQIKYNRRGILIIRHDEYYCIKNIMLYLCKINTVIELMTEDRKRGRCVYPLIYKASFNSHWLQYYDHERIMY